MEDYNIIQNQKQVLRARGDRTWFAGPAAEEEGGQLPRREEPPTPPQRRSSAEGGGGRRSLAKGESPAERGGGALLGGGAPPRRGGVRRSPAGWGGAPQASGSQCALSKSTDHPGPTGSARTPSLWAHEDGGWLCGPPRLPLRARPSHSRPRGSTLLPERSVLTAKGRNKGQDKPDDCVLSSFLIRNGKRRAAGSQ